MKNICDILIIGGGPAGTTAAACAIKHRLKVCLIDKNEFPRDKICGDFVIIKSLEVFERCKIDLSDIANLSIPSNAVTISDGNTQKIEIGINQKPIFGVLSKRIDFDAYLFSKIKHHVNSFLGYTISIIEKSDNGYVVTIENKSSKEIEKIQTKYIVGADGASSYIRRQFFNGLRLEYAIATREYCQIIADVHQFTMYYFPEIEDGGYFWVFPVSDKEVNCGIILFTDQWKNNFASIAAAHQYYAKKVLGHESSKEDIKSWSLPLNTEKQNYCVNNVLLVGDAAGLIDPTFGHGIDPAIYSGEIAIKHIAAHHRQNGAYDLDSLYSKEINDKFIENYIIYKRFRNSRMKVNDQLMGHIDKLFVNPEPEFIGGIIA